MIVAMVDVGFVRILNSVLESFPGSLRSELRCKILAALGFVEDLRLASNIKVLAQRIEPFKDGAVT